MSNDLDAEISSRFLNLRHSLDFLWGYVARTYILAAVREFAIATTGPLLDVGCGRQPYRSLFTAVSSYVGVDVPTSPHSRARGSVLFDGEQLPFADGAFAACLATEVFEHVRRPEKLLSECRRVLRPGGRVFLTVPFVIAQHEAPHDYRRLTRFGLELLAQDVGLVDVQVRPLGGYHAAIAHVLGQYATHRLSLPVLRMLVFPTVWVLQKMLLALERADPRPKDEFTLGWSMCATAPDHAHGQSPHP